MRSGIGRWVAIFLLIIGTSTDLVDNVVSFDINLVIINMKFYNSPPHHHHQDVSVTKQASGMKESAAILSRGSRKLKELKSYNLISSEIKQQEGLSNANRDDYHIIDPVPSSKAAIKTGPIEHSTPWIPYIPQQPVAPPTPMQAAPPPNHVGHP